MTGSRPRPASQVPAIPQAPAARKIIVNLPVLHHNPAPAEIATSITAAPPPGNNFIAYLASAVKPATVFQADQIDLVVIRPDGSQVRCIADTGAKVSVINEAYARELCLSTRPCPEIPNLSMGNGVLEPALGAADLNIRLVAEGPIQTVKVIVTPSTPPELMILLGIRDLAGYCVDLSSSSPVLRWVEPPPWRSIGPNRTSGATYPRDYPILILQRSPSTSRERQSHQQDRSRGRTLRRREGRDSQATTTVRGCLGSCK
jgi:hypothetical protein